MGDELDWRSMARCFLEFDDDGEHVDLVDAFYPPAIYEGKAQARSSISLLDSTSFGRRFCAWCPVWSSCLAWAMVTERYDWDHSGIFGGLTPPERGKLKRIMYRLKQSGAAADPRWYEENISLVRTAISSTYKGG